MRFFDDDAGFEQFRSWDESYPSPGHPYPESWVERHYLAMLNAMGGANGLEWRLDATRLGLPGVDRSMTMATFDTVDLETFRAATAASIARTADTRQAAEKVRRAVETRQAEEAANRQRAEAARREREAWDALKELVRTAGDLRTKEGIDALSGRLTEFSTEHAGTESAERAASESAALVKLRLAYVWAERPGADPLPRLRQVAKDHPHSLAARAARGRLAEGR